MPLQRRLPKFGFHSAMSKDCAELRLDQLAKLGPISIDLEALWNAKVFPKTIKRVKVILAGTITQAVVLKGIAVTKGAKQAIEAAGGRIE